MHQPESALWFVSVSNKFSSCVWWFMSWLVTTTVCILWRGTSIALCWLPAVAICWRSGQWARLATLSACPLLVTPRTIESAPADTIQSSATWRDTQTGRVFPEFVAAHNSGVTCALQCAGARKKFTGILSQWVSLSAFWRANQNSDLHSFEHVLFCKFKSLEFHGGYATGNFFDVCSCICQCISSADCSWVGHFPPSRFPSSSPDFWQLQVYVVGMERRWHCAGHRQRK